MKNTETNNGTKALHMADVISRLRKLERIDLYEQDIETHIGILGREQIEDINDDGKYIRSADLSKLIDELNGL